MADESPHIPLDPQDARPSFRDEAYHVPPVELFHFDPSKPSFDDLGQENGERYWWESDLKRCLGYTSREAFLKAVSKAMTACVALGIDVGENFRPEKRTVDGVEVSDTKLSRFACFLVAMNADPRKTEVARAQVYFAGIAAAFEQYLAHAESVERVVIREDVSDREKSMVGAAKAYGVRDFALFQNAGYRGMYNMNLSRLRALRGLPDGRSPLDFMGKTELAANLFRITQTEEKIRGDGVRGQQRLEITAESVGRKVRQTMIEISGTRPEHLAAVEDLRDVKKSLKKTHREMRRLDTPAQPAKALKPARPKKADSGER